MWRSAIILASILAASYISPSARTGVPASAQVLIPPGISIHQVDGGTAYYGRFSPSLPDDPGFFPVGVWFESVLSDVDVSTDRAAGLNTYVQLTDESDVDLVKSNGLHAFPSILKSGSAGFVVSDEVDMWGGGGSSNWTGRTQGEGIICDPPDSACGFMIQEALKENFPRQSLLYSNYGKGVTFHLKDSEAAQFVNQYQDVVSADNYWFTDPYICSPVEGGAVFAAGRELSDEECRTAAHYGWTVDRVRSLVQPAGSKPVWAFVEVGQPFSDSTSPSASPAQVRAAVWSSLIHGARGIVYFNHNFGGTCLSQHVLRDECGGDVRPTVTAVNHLISSLAPALNAPSVTGLVTSRTTGVDMLVKANGGHIYLMAASTRNERSDVAFSITCGSPEQVTVLDEGRTIPMSGKTFTDTFENANAVHIYRFDGGSSCNLGIN